MRIKSARYSLVRPKPSSGQAMVESVICFVLLLTFLFAVMDFAMVANVLFTLHDASQTAARAAAVRQNATIAATALLVRTIGVVGNRGEFTGVTIRRRTVSSDDYWGIPGTLTEGSTQDIRVITATVNYLYRPLFAFTPLMTRIPLSSTYTIMEEPVLPRSGSS